MFAVKHKVTGLYLHRKYRSAHKRWWYAGYVAGKKGIKADEEAYSADINNAALFATEGAVKQSYYGCGIRTFNEATGQYTFTRQFPTYLEIVEVKIHE